MDVAVVGCGYVGLVTGVSLASLGHTVTGIDTDAARLEVIRAGRAPFHEPGLDELLAAALASGAFSVSSELRSATEVDVVLLAVQTPPRPDGSVELAFLEDVVRALATELATAPTRRRVVGIRSTVPPGTNEKVVAPILSRIAELAVVSNPEFLREGTAVDDVLHADRIVVGSGDSWAAETVGRLYDPFGAPLVVTRPATAELAKYASNALLGTLISFSNEIARLCEATPGVDVEDVLGIVHRDRRLASGGRPASIVSYLRAGCGYGGSCLVKDIAALAHYGASVGERTAILDAVASVNAGQASRLVDLAERALGGLEGRSVAVLGAAFKAGTVDLRHSPGLGVAGELVRRGAAVVVYDPLVSPSVLEPHLAAGVTIGTTLDSTVEAVEACFVTTAAPEFESLAARHPGCLVVDGRRALDAARFDGRYVAIGRGS